MPTALEQLLRDTMLERAQDFSSAPEWAGPPARRHGRPWLAAGAVAAAVIVVAGGATLLRPTTGHEGAAGTGAGTACMTTTLPADWRSALAHTDPTFHGEPVLPGVRMSGGRSVGVATSKAGPSTVLLTGADGNRTVLDTVAADRMVTGVDADDRWIAISTAPIPADPAARPSSEFDRVALVDTQGSARIDVLADAPAAATAHIQGSRRAWVQDGAVYWLSAPTPDATEGTVERYDIASATYAAIAHADGGSEIDRDVRGVGWHGGSVPAADVPSFLPDTFAGGNFLPVFADGSAFAWRDAVDSPIVRWAGPDGTRRSWTVHTTGDPDYSPGVDAVSGPFVFLGLGDLGNGVYVLDTRSGAIAYLGDGTAVSYPSLVTAGPLVLVHGNDETATTVDPRTLSALDC